MRKLTTETTRFLNGIERERIAAARTIKIAADDFNHEQEERIAAENECARLRERLAVACTATATATAVAARFEAAARMLLPKLRADIYSGATTTPRWFESGKWWSRETGGLDVEFVTEMTSGEILEATEFYGKTELPLMLPRSRRAEIVEAV